jgi:hypothetical protein
VSPWRRERHALGIDGARLVAADAAPLHTLDPAQAWTAELLVRALRPWWQRKGRGAWRVLVAPDLCKHWTQQPPAGLRSLDELRQLTQLQAARLFGASPADWLVQADWQFDQPFACVAMPAALVSAWIDCASDLKAGLQVESAVWVALRRAFDGRRSVGWTCWSTPGTQVMARSDGRRVTALRCLRHGLGNDPDAARLRLQGDLHQLQLALATPPGEPARPAQRLPRWSAHDSEAQWALQLGLGVGLKTGAA